MVLVHVKQGSLTDGDELVLVNASNTEGNLGTGVSAAIRAACGAGFQAHVHAELRKKKQGSMEPGEVLVTDAGTHPRARYVAHVAVMDYRGGSRGTSLPDATRIEKACQNLWTALEGLPERRLSVAMVALGAGTGQLGVRLPTEIACRTLRAHLAAQAASRIEAVTFYGYAQLEFFNVYDEVSQKFALNADELSPDMRAMLDVMRR